MCQKVNRHYYKCPLCLTVCAVAAEHQQAILCGYCSAPMEHMGRVERDRLVKEYETCACDDRCIYAQGPKCNCHCGGQYHGSKMVVTVRIDNGKVVAEVTPTAQAVRDAKEYQETRERALTEWRALNTRKHAGWIPPEDFRRWLALHTALADARKKRSHKGRMKDLAAVGYTPERKPVTLAAETENKHLAPIGKAPAGRLF